MRLFGVKIENLSSGARVLHLTINLVISGGCQEEDRRDMSENRELKISTRVLRRGRQPEVSCFPF